MKAMLAMASCLAVTACSVNENGFVHVENIAADGAMMRRTFAPGAHLAIDDDGAAFTLGAVERIRITQKHCLEATDARGSGAMATLERTYGLSLAAKRWTFGATLGYRELLVLVDVDPTVDFARRITVDLANLEDTVLVTQTLACAR